MAGVHHRGHILVGGRCLRRESRSTGESKEETRVEEKNEKYTKKAGNVMRSDLIVSTHTTG
jgi:hypothetical protein